MVNIALLTVHCGELWDVHCVRWLIKGFSNYTVTTEVSIIMVNTGVFSALGLILWCSLSIMVNTGGFIANFV